MTDNQPISEQYARAGLDWADKEAAASLLEDTKSSVLSEMIGNLLDTEEGNKIAFNRAEQVIKASPEWKDHIKKIVEARQVANRAKIRLEYLRMKFQESMSHAADERLVAKL